MKISNTLIVLSFLGLAITAISNPIPVTDDNAINTLKENNKIGSFIGKLKNHRDPGQVKKRSYYDDDCDTEIDDDGIVDGIVGSAIDTIVGTVTDIILDSAGLRDRHANVQNTYGNVTGFSTQTTNDTNDNYKVTYVIDYDTISDNDLARFNLSRDLDDLRDSYVNQGFTCK